jgi:hypothetical protein
MNNKSQANDVNVIHKGRENTRGKTLAKHHNAQKWARSNRSLTSRSP